jgi:hypothetical protein
MVSATSELAETMVGLFSATIPKPDVFSGVPISLKT